VEWRRRNNSHASDGRSALARDVPAAGPSHLGFSLTWHPDLPAASRIMFIMSLIFSGKARLYASLRFLKRHFSPRPALGADIDIAALSTS